MTFVIMTPK